MGDKKDKTDSEDGSNSDSLEIFDDIFGEEKAADVPDTKQGQPGPTAPPVKAAGATTAKKAEQRVAPQKAPPAKKAAPPVQPIKTSPQVIQAKTKEEQPVSEPKDASFSDGQDLFDSIFSEDAAAAEAKKGPAPAALPVKEAAQHARILIIRGRLPKLS